MIFFWFWSQSFMLDIPLSKAIYLVNLIPPTYLDSISGPCDHSSQVISPMSSKHCLNEFSILCSFYSYFYGWKKIPEDCLQCSIFYCWHLTGCLQILIILRKNFPIFVCLLILLAIQILIGSYTISYLLIKKSWSTLVTTY